MRTHCFSLALIGAVASVIGCGGGTFGHGGGKALVTINGKTITEGDLEFLGTINPRLKAQASNPFGQKQIVDNLVEQELLYQESVRRGLDKDAKVKTKADLYRRIIVAQAALDNELEGTAERYYNEHKAEFEKVELAHILIRFKGAGGESAKGAAKEKDTATRPEAQAVSLANDLKERLTKGEDFAKVAKEASEDPGSKNAGGLLGKVWKGEQRLERRGYGPLLEKAFTMKVGEVAGPIKTEEGYHLITLTKGIEQQPLDEARQSILFKVQGDVRGKFLADLKQKAKIEYAEGLADQKPPAAPGQPGATGPAQPGEPAQPAQPTPSAPSAAGGAGSSPEKPAKP